MKKRISLIFLLLLALGLCVVVGFKKIPTTYNITQNDNKEIIIEEKSESVTQGTNLSQTAVNEQTSNVDKNNETIESNALTDKDREVKSEISKHINTTIDFRYNKQETLHHREETLSFFGVEEFQGKKELITYKNDFGDKFLYKADTGKLFLARINSNVVKKLEESIDINIAQKMADVYVLENYGEKELMLSQSQELDEGYFFVYSKFIFGYNTNVTFEIIISFDGDIVYIRDNTDALKKVNINVNKSLIEQKKQEIISNYADINTEIKGVSILIENDKIFLVTTVTDVTTGFTAEILSEIKG